MVVEEESEEVRKEDIQGGVDILLKNHIKEDRVEKNIRENQGENQGENLKEDNYFEISMWK